MILISGRQLYRYNCADVKKYLYLFLFVVKAQHSHILVNENHLHLTAPKLYHIILPPVKKKFSIKAQDVIENYNGQNFVILYNCFCWTAVKKPFVAKTLTF